MTLEMKLAEERKEGYAEGAAEQRAKDEAVILAKDAELELQSAKLARYEKLYGKLEA